MLVAFSVVIMATVVAVAATVTAETMATATLSDAGGGEVEEAVTSKTLSVLVDIQRVGLTEGVKLTWDNL